MKSTKSPRIGLSHRTRSSKSLQSGDKSTSDARQSTDEEREHVVKENRKMDKAASRGSDSATSTQGFAVGQDAAALEQMRQRMSEAMAQKQQTLASSPSPPSTAQPASKPMPEPADTLSRVESISSESVQTSAMSTDSAQTVKATPSQTPAAVKTPSYPFPRMQMKFNRQSSHRSGPSHRPFTLLSPTNEPISDQSPLPRPVPHQGSSEVSTPVGTMTNTERGMVEDPNYPTPDLYDVILMLNAEPGLDMWWANTTDLLSESYGAERATLALPGDITDLENVPWGQKATYNFYGSESGGQSTLDSAIASDIDVRSLDRSHDQHRSSSANSSQMQRPPLQSRHSIAGVRPETSDRSRMRPSGPLRALSTLTPHCEEPEMSPQAQPSRGPAITRQSATPRTQSTFDMDIVRNYARNDTETTSEVLRCHVHGALQPLEAEVDPLLVRTGVASLFGKRKPVVLTRAYSEDTPRSPRPGSARGGDDNRSQPLRSSALSARTPSNELPEQPARSVKVVDEYEQPEPSPWSQSPSPSPAARPDPDESPFFAQPSTSIDEAAFEQYPPQYDYGATINAIGADMSKTLVHIPLIQPVPARGGLASSLRFPVAILSFMSSLNPYPRNLRHSLASLLPHLASSYSLAQQYSNLQDRSRPGVLQRHGAAFGLGGTFSDEGSELELVAELSGQIAQEKNKTRVMTRQSSVRTPYDERPPPIRGSPHSSVPNTPSHETFGMNSQPPTPGQSGADIIEGYFSAKRTAKSGNQARTPGEDVGPTGKVAEKTATAIKGSRKSGSGGSSKSHLDQHVPASPRPSSQASGSDYGDPSTQLDRYEHYTRRTSTHRDSGSKEDGEKPLPELISSLMLNAVPLQLFLAKPGKGDLVWTNRKFDAYRIQSNQVEGQRVRDPWKNVHVDDRPGLVKLWQEALKTGSQFTHYVRVKRFNSDSDFRWFVFRASTLLSNNGRLLYWVGSYLDVHEHYTKTLEASEREATMARDAKIRALADAIPQILFEAMEDEGIVSVNQQWHAYSGQSFDDARGIGFARHVYREDLHKCGILSASEAAAVYKSGSHNSSSSSSSNKTAGPIPSKQKNLFAPDPSSLDYMVKQGSVTVEQDENERLSYLTEIRLRSRRGEYRWFLVRLSKVDKAASASGKASWYGTCTDIETRKALERELNQANEKVHSEMEGKTKFFANMSHEIRTPLNGIIGSMPWLVESLLDHDQRRTVDTIQNSANNLRELVDNILDVTKVEAGKMTLLPKWFHVRTLCEEVVDTVSSRAIERGLELNYTLSSNMPVNVKGDPFRIRQVLLNLMGNSVKFTEQGEIFMRCTLRDGPEHTPGETLFGFLCFDIIDTGRGFNANEFERLFKQFGQIGSGTNHDAGSGLGLFLSKQLVEMHGGDLTVKSTAGEGSTFSFYIRVELALPGTENTSPQSTARPTNRHRSSVSGGSVRSQSDSTTPTMAGQWTSQKSSVMQSPGLSRFVSSPDTQPPSAATSPPIVSPTGISPNAVTSSSGQSIRSNSISNMISVSTSTSLAPTPESTGGKDTPSQGISSERQAMLEKAVASHPAIRRSKSSNDGGTFAPDTPHPATYSVVVICPAEHARAAIKQHIEHVIPLSIPANVTTLPDFGAFLALMNGPTSPTFTHIVLDIPASSDIMLFMRQMTNFTAAVIPVLVVVTDHYQKRDILEDFQTLVSTGRKAFLTHKPVKPSVFAMIFDPAQLRNLSKDRAREVAQTGHDDFKATVNLVKDRIGNRQFRVLLVEDSDVNRMVIVRYLKKVSLENESAKDGQECLDMIFGKPAGYYSLIICDIQMPRKNGYEACTEVRSWERENGLPPCPIMALTANAMPEERSAAGAAGFTDYLTKPVDFNVLGNMLMTLLDPRVPHLYLRDRPVDG